MSSHTYHLWRIVIVLLLAGVGVSASAAPPSEALEAYANAYTEMGKNAAVMFNNDKVRADAQTSMFNAWVDAQCKMMTAQAGWITAVANAKATDAKTQETLQQVRSLALDNSLKTAKTFYDKRKLHDDCRKAHTCKRPTQKDISRYSQVSVPKRPANFELASAQGRVSWPEVLLNEEFSDGRLQLESLFAQRRSAAGSPRSNVAGEVRTVVAQMREQLKSKIHQVAPAEYVAARKFLVSLAYEGQLPAPVGRVASN
jgi:hypothetical protein